MNYVLLPGNPPAAHFYELWGQEIRIQHPDARVRVSHYPDLKYSTDSKRVMQEVLDAHFEQLEVFYKETGAPVILVGHSLGGYFALELLRRASGMTLKAILVHPFLRRPTLPGLVTLNAAGSLYKSELFHRSFLRWKRGLELIARDLAHVTNEEVLRSFHLARHESQTIGKDRSPIMIEPHLRDMIRVFYSPQDIWCTPEVLANLKPQVETHECTEPHGFVTNAEHRRSLFNRF